MAEAGWYPDVTNEGWLAYWDGQRWTGDRHAAQQQPQQPQQPQVQPGPGPHEQTTRLGDLRTEQQPPVPAGPPQAQLPADPHQTWQPPADQGWQPPADQGWQPPADQGWQPPADQGWQPPADQGWQPPADQGWQPPADQWVAPAAPQQQAPQWQQWQVPASGYATEQFGAPPSWQQPQPPRRNRKRLIIAGVAVVVIAAGLLTWLLLPGDGPTLTYNGKNITSADKVLSTAEGQLKAAVKARHGATNADTRCYFAKPKKQPSGKRATDVQSSLRCGPVLFVDGDKSRPYVAIPLHNSAANGDAKLTTSASSFATARPEAVPAGVTLARPDGASAPSGNDGLSVPKPPPAPADVLTTATLGPAMPPKALDNAVMTGRSSKVTVTSAGTIERYGSGDTARTAASGQTLLAFQVDYGAGDVDAGGPHATLAVTGQPARPIPTASGENEWVIASVPVAGSAKVVLTDGGYTQTLSLPDGKPGASNIAVLNRVHRTAFLFGSFNVPLHLTKPGATGDVTFHARTTAASLDFWIPRHTDQHASSPNKAILSVGLTYTDSKDPGKIFGFDPQLVRLRLPGGQLIHSRNVAASGKIDDVFEVPANFTTGRVEIDGTENVGDVHVRVTKTKSFAVSIPAG